VPELSLQVPAKRGWYLAARAYPEQPPRLTGADIRRFVHARRVELLAFAAGVLVASAIGAGGLSDPWANR
jgi:hypothetical protein